jgi:serine protease AprX
MRKVTFAVLAGVVLVFTGLAVSQVKSDINAGVAQLDVGKATLNDVIRIFGEPEKYLWGDQTFTKDNLPSIYIAAYPNGFRVVIKDGKIHQLRFEEIDAGYVFKDKLRIGSSLDEVLDVIGQPTETVVGEALQGAATRDGVLYKDIDGRKGYCYYGRKDQDVMFFFGDYKVTAIYVTFGNSDRSGGSGSFKTIRPINSVKEFDDVRWKDMSKLNLSDRRGLIATLRFNQKTVWPEPAKMPVGDGPEKLLKDAMNPGLGIRKLHEEGITGKGVNVAIIDQPLYQDHPEFAGKIVEYYDTGCETESSMHGPAVASLLVGTNCGTAPDARVYYVAAPSGTKDTAYQAKALDWIVGRNERLPVSEKIRVVSVSAAPSGHGSPFEKNQEMWDRACVRAEAAGILVLDCTIHHGFIEKCWYNARVPESVSACTPGDPRYGYSPTDRLLVPSAPRTTAEEYDKGDCSYQYCGTGGLSWSIPYCAGVLALGWQIRPELTPKQMRELLFKSAYTKKDGAKIIHPEKFIRLVKTEKGQTVSGGRTRAGND